ncbi:MAG TPA: hypothetical protein VLW65_03955 [Bryobacteraceae bacterium]|nr:hypothetical protein [Bryobacteraceae bacterium]
MKKSLLIFGFVSLSSLALAGTKSYEIVLDTPVKAGAVQLPAGDYKVKVDGSKAIFTDTRTNKSVSTDIKLKTGERKFSHTAVDSSKDGSQDRIDAIELGGSSTEIDFAY